MPLSWRFPWMGSPGRGLKKHGLETERKPAILTRARGKKETLIVCLLALVLALLGAGIIYAGTVMGGYGGSPPSSSGPPPYRDHSPRKLVSDTGVLGLISEYLGNSSTTGTITKGRDNPSAGWYFSDINVPPWHHDPKGGSSHHTGPHFPATLAHLTRLIEGQAGYNPFFVPSSGPSGSSDRITGTDGVNTRPNGGTPISPAVPAPTPVLLLGSGLVAFILLRRQRACPDERGQDKSMRYKSQSPFTSRSRRGSS